MNVCHITTVHDPFDVRIFQKECVTLAQAGHQVTLIAPADFQERTVQGVRVLGVAKAGSRLGRVHLWRSILARVRELQPDVVHFHDPDLLLVAPFTGAPIRIYDCHEQNAMAMLNKPWMPKPFQKPMYHLVTWLEPALAWLNSAVVIVDEGQAPIFDGIGRPVSLVRNFPKADTMAQTGPQEQAKAILHLGAQSRTRGTSVLVESFPWVVEAVPDAQLWLVGPFNHPPYRKQLEQRIAELGLEDHVVMPGAVPYEQVSDWLSRAAVGVVGYQRVTQYENCTPTKLFEYMLAGMPVVATDVWSNSRYLAGREFGFLVEPDDPRAFAQAFIRLLTEPGLARRMGEEALEVARTIYSWEAEAEKLLALYADLAVRLGKRTGSRRDPEAVLPG